MGGVTAVLRVIGAAPVAVLSAAVAGLGLVSGVVAVAAVVAVVAVVAVGAAVVPDPYHGGSHGFDHVLDLVEDACEGLLLHVQKKIAVA